MADLLLENGSLVYRTPYNPVLVEALKAAVPAGDRRWDSYRKVWLVTPRHADTLAAITRQYLGETLHIPAVAGTSPQPEQRLLEVRYIGRCKPLGDSSAAYGYCQGEWSVIFPEDTLRMWFDAEARPDEAATLYATLGVQRGATADEIKRAYRRMALQWHPDTCREAGAAEQFKRIHAAYEIVSDPGRRARYDAGLALEASLATRAHRQRLADLPAGNGYRSPLRCGMILTAGLELLGRFRVSAIQQWEDIVDARGRVLVTSWPAGAETFSEVWR